MEKLSLEQFEKTVLALEDELSEPTHVVIKAAQKMRKTLQYYANAGHFQARLCLDEISEVLDA